MHSPGSGEARGPHDDADTRGRRTTVAGSRRPGRGGPVGCGRPGGSARGRPHRAHHHGVPKWGCAHSWAGSTTTAAWKNQWRDRAEILAEHRDSRCSRRPLTAGVRQTAARPRGLVIRPRVAGRTSPKWSIGDQRNVGVLALQRQLTPNNQGGCQDA